MPYEIPPTEDLIVSCKRMLNMGPPSSFKTTSLMTWPGPIHIQSYPGERGDATIPRNRPGVTPHLWSESEAGKKPWLPRPTPSGTIVQLLEQRTFEILGGKYGEIRTFAGDGIHKYYSYVLDYVTAGAFFRGEEFEARLYARSHEHFRHYIQAVMNSPVEYVVFTCWDGKEADEAGAKSGPSHIYPNLPGKMAKEIMGEFGVVVYSIVDWAARQPNKPAPAYWQLLPEGKVWGAAVKAPYEVVMKLPVKIPQGLPVLEATLAKAYTEAYPEVKK